MSAASEPAVTAGALARARTPGRLGYLDDLKVALTAGIIVAHAAMTYGALGEWAYTEPGLSNAAGWVLGFALAFGDLFALGTFFLVAGLFVPGSLARKGARRYLRDRLVRLGVPLAASTLLIWPVTWFAAGWAMTGDAAAALGSALHQVALLDPGPLWFVAVLLIYSAAFAAWRRLRPARTGAGGALGPRDLLVAGLVIAAATVPVRLVWPIMSYQPLSLHMYLWPQLVVLFWLGALGAERGWFGGLSLSLRRGAAAIAILSALSIPLLVVLSGGDPRAFYGGWGWEAAVSALVQGAIAVSMSVWLVDWFRRHEAGGRLARELARGAYGAFVLHAPVLVAGALLLRPLPLPGELKFVVLAAAGVAGSFALADLLARRVPVVRRVLA